MPSFELLSGAYAYANEGMDVVVTILARAQADDPARRLAREPLDRSSAPGSGGSPTRAAPRESVLRWTRRTAFVGCDGRCCFDASTHAVRVQEDLLRLLSCSPLAGADINFGQLRRNCVDVRSRRGTPLAWPRRRRRIDSSRTFGERFSDPCLPIDRCGIGRQTRKARLAGP